MTSPRTSSFVLFPVLYPGTSKRVPCCCSPRSAFERIPLLQYLPFGVVCATVLVLYFFFVLAACFGSLGFPFYASTKGLTLVSWIPHYGPCFHYISAPWFFLVCLSTNCPTLASFFVYWIFLFICPTDGPAPAFHVQRCGPWRSFRQCSLLFLSWHFISANDPSTRPFGPAR